MHRQNVDREIAIVYLMNNNLYGMQELDLAGWFQFNYVFWYLKFKEIKIALNNEVIFRIDEIIL